MTQKPSNFDDSAVEETQPHAPHLDETRVTVPRWEPGEAPTMGFEVPQPPPPDEPDDPLGHFQPIRVARFSQPAIEPPTQSKPAPPRRRWWHKPPKDAPPTPQKPPRERRGCGCWWVSMVIPFLALVLVYLLFPLRTNLLILGIDRAPEGTDASRTDTNILLSVIPLRPTVNMLSIPRDLWVALPGGGEDRINTAHFYAEAARPGSGPQAALQTVRDNFGVTVRYYARIRFDGVQDIVDSMGGVTVNLPAPMSGYDAGPHTLNGEQALAFARDRQGSDDFFRMQRGQLLIQSAIVKMVNPLNWGYLPGTVAATMRSVDTNLPVWEMPRMGLALVRAALSNTLNARTITREMVTPFTTNQGANVLLPNWDAINPLLLEMFGE